MNWRESRLWAVDTETTGTVPGTDRIVELGAVSFHMGASARMGSLINPLRPIPEEAVAVHGIRDEDVRDKPTLQEIAPRFLERVREAEVLVGYNWPFDAAMLDAGLGQWWRDAIAGKPILDALVVVRLDAVGRWWKGKGRHKLDEAARRLGIKWAGALHRASRDAELAMRVLFQCWEQLPADAQEASDFIAEQRQIQERQFQEWLSRQPPLDTKASA